MLYATSIMIRQSNSGIIILNFCVDLQSGLSVLSDRTQDWIENAVVAALNVEL